ITDIVSSRISAEGLDLYRENESPLRRNVRRAIYWLRCAVVRKLSMEIRRFEASEFGLSPIPVLKGRIQTGLEFHEKHCDLSDFTGYCPKAGRYWSLPVNYCPQCTLSLARIRGYKLVPGQIVFIDQRQRMA